LLSDVRWAGWLLGHGDDEDGASEEISPYSCHRYHAFLFKADEKDGKEKFLWHYLIEDDLKSRKSFICTEIVVLIIIFKL
jgi:hypothetical protein